MQGMRKDDDEVVLLHVAYNLSCPGGRFRNGPNGQGKIDNRTDFKPYQGKGPVSRKTCVVLPHWVGQSYT
jgi:hypothetical protein